MINLAAKFREAADGASDVARISVSAADLRAAADALDERDALAEEISQYSVAQEAICNAWNWGAKNVRYRWDLEKFSDKMETAIIMLPGVTRK
jgi:hypothetical protein